MRKTCLFSAALAMASWFAPAAVLPAALAQTPAEKVAIVNPARAFNEAQETRDLRAKLENDRKQLEDQERQKRQRIQELQNARDQLRPDAPQYAERNRELQQAAVEFEVWGRMVQQDVQRNQKLQMKQLFDKIANATAEVAKAKGVDLVVTQFNPETPENLDQINADQLRALLNSRNVLYFNEAADLTDEVIAALDAAYKGAQ